MRLGSCPDAETRSRRGWCIAPPGRGCAGRRAQRWRLVGLLVSAGDVWACVLELNAWRRARRVRPLVSYQELCRELACAGPGAFGNLTAWARGRCCAAIPMPGSPPQNADGKVISERGSRGGGERADAGALVSRRLHPHRTAAAAAVARGRPPLWVQLDPDLPYPAEQVRSVTLLYDAGRLWIDAAAEIPVASYRAGHERNSSRLARSVDGGSSARTQ